MSPTPTSSSTACGRSWRCGARCCPSRTTRSESCLRLTRSRSRRPSTRPSSPASRARATTR
nr:MAG: hypothetical protein [Molluscum contagiosum virus]